MHPRRSHLIAAGALLAGTALLGAAARSGGSGRGPDHPPAGRATFSAPGGGAVSFSGTLDRRAVLLGRDGLAHMELVIAAPPDERSTVARWPTDVVIVLDRSGSMDGAKLVHARAALHELLAQLGGQDRFALVTYSDSAALTVPLSPLDARPLATWGGIVAEIQAAGGTNMSSGLDLALEVVESARAAGRVPHVVLISDGLANQGDATPEGLMRRAGRAARGEYMLSTVGVGADFNESLLTAIADAGTGNYYYVSDPRELAGVFAREFDAARTTVATGLAVQIEPGPGVRVVHAAGYPLETAGAGVLFRPGSLFAGQTRRVWVTFAVPQQAVGEYDLGGISLAYGDAADRRTLRFSETPRVACVRGEDEFYAGLDADAWARSVVVDTYNAMQAGVARAVKEGRRDYADMLMRSFRSETKRMNERVQSTPVTQQLESLDRLKAEVDAAFEGPNQPERQNALGKAAGAAAADARRAGSKR